MHRDEARDPAQHEEHLLAEFVSDPAGLRTTYIDLQARVERLQRQGAKLEKELSEARTLARQVPDLSRRLGSAHGALNAYRSENRRLKKDLARLRQSRALRFSRLVNERLGYFRPTRSVDRDASTASPSPAHPGIADVPMASSPSIPTDPPTTVEQAPVVLEPSVDGPVALWGKRPSECTYDELKQRLAGRPTTEALNYVLNRAWFVHGLVDDAVQTLDDWPELAATLQGPARDLVGRIRGAHRLRAAREWVPGRSPGAAYVTERDRVLYCVHSTPAYNSNGYSTRTRGVASALSANGAEIRVVARAGYPWDTRTDRTAPARERSVTELDGVEYVHLTGPHEGRDPHDRVILQMADAFVREARLYRPSLIQAASNYRTGLAALIAARRLGLPFVYEVRGLWELTEASDKTAWQDSDRFRIAKDLETLVATEADHVLAITQEVADELVRRGVDERRIGLLPNGIDPDQITPLYPDQRLQQRFSSGAPGPTDLPTVGFAGSMVPYEGLDLLLEASAILHEQGLAHRVVLAGSGPAEPGLRQMVSDRGLGHVTFLGRLPSGDIPALLSSLDVIACPRRSTLITELVSPLKPLEAMAAARAVVLSDVAPNRTIAGADGKRAVLHAADDPHALAAALAPLLSDPDARRRLGRHARRWILEERTWSALGAKALAGHRAAAEHSCAVAGSANAIPLRDLRVGVVADEFTTATLAAEVAATSLGRSTWREQLDQLDPHLVLIESAWDNHGEWHRGIGYYSPEEHADFRALVQECRRRGVPTVFWNKEDPVHFARFVRSAVECDHIFTTDANMLPRYLAAATHARTASTLPFYAAPTLHNPLPGTLEHHGGTSYAGTFYGQRFAKRSQELARLLTAASPFGLTIFDRQADTPDSPYRFPPSLQRYVAGALPYGQVLDAYKAHTANLNVNSVADSPSMFSRRVVEVAASGAVVLSAPGRGIVETFGSAIACSGDARDWRALLRAWTTDPSARREEAWLQMRSVLRAHTTGTALTIVARTAGLRVEAPSLTSYSAAPAEVSETMLRAVAEQSVLPRVVYVGAADPAAARALLPAQVEVRSGEPPTDSTELTLRLFTVPDRSAAEDLLHALSWGRWSWVCSHGELPVEPPYARPDAGEAPRSGLLLENRQAAAGSPGLLLSRPQMPASAVDPPEQVPHMASPSLTGLRVLVAGHDLKFARGLIEAADAAGAHVTLDQWTSHTEHDEAASMARLQEADVVFCEWGLGNAVWYSRHVQQHQRLVVRVHAQELRRPYLRQVRHDRVDLFVFVGRTVLESAVASHDVPRDKAVVVHNPVDVTALRQPKWPGADHTLGLVGAVPRSKRPDLALDLLESLREQDSRYRLRIKGHRPSHYGWLRHVPGEMAYYDTLEARIDELNRHEPGVVTWDPHGDDVAEWFRNVGVALSVSDHESFHFTVADGAASGALPAVLTWPGAEYLYRGEWLCSDLDELAERVLTAQVGDEGDVVAETYAKHLVLPELLRHVVGSHVSVRQFERLHG
ncbi:glycosyltransferase [Serinicoccus marinus]|uniref:glycosyltransferase n=1 Tax=Serinicoccus marinus TaxID=247333 RepID=UPI002490D6CB|nr:glycosyltransferase [Serinicoccus marinus]